MASPDALATPLAEIARKAGRLLAGFHARRPAPSMKPDLSPVTEADRASEALILSEVGRLFPGLPVISEENAVSHAADGGREFLLVDPLDGTRAFLAGTADFCVSIALIREGRRLPECFMRPSKMKPGGAAPPSGKQSAIWPAPGPCPRPQTWRGRTGCGLGQSFPRQCRN